MLLIHKGFDNLDLAYCLQLPASVVPKFEEAKANAAKVNAPVPVTVNGLWFNVAPTGAAGGYVFRMDTGPLGEIWCFKRPSRRDPWGVRVSVSAVRVALHGLKRTREHLESVLRTLEMDPKPGDESIARVDFAMDFLYPDLELDERCFIRHPRSSHAKHGPLEAETYHESGSGGRVTGLTIGKNPGRQIVVYDKRNEVIQTGKSHWLEIWNHNRKEAGKPPIDITDPATSRVWRVELRAYKKHLKDDWKIKTWYDLQTHIVPMFMAMTDDVRFQVPTADTNRSRWPNHPLWDRVREEIDDHLMNVQSFASIDRVRELLRSERDEMIQKQIDGCLIARAGLNGIADEGLEDFVRFALDESLEAFRRTQSRTDQKLQEARDRYVGLR